MLEALKKRYEAQVAESIATINIYLKSPVGIGEHPQHLDEVDKLPTNIYSITNGQSCYSVMLNNSGGIIKSNTNSLSGSLSN